MIPVEPAQIAKDRLWSGSGGKWAIEELSSGGLSGDSGLVLKEKAKHHAIITDTQIFKFDHDLTVQYEVAFQVLYSKVKKNR